MHNNPIEEKITQALESYPLAELPHHFVENVLAQVQAAPQKKKRSLPFSSERSFLPAALVVFAVVFIGVVVWNSRLLLEQINPLRIAYYQNLIQYWQMRLSFHKIPTPSIFIFLTAVVAAFYGLLYLVTDPQRELG